MLPPRVALVSLFTFLASRCQRGREFRTGDLHLQGVVESQAHVLFVLVFMRVNSFILFALC